MVDRLKQQYEGKVEFRNYKVDADQAAIKVFTQLGGTGVPEFYFINSDGTLANKIIGGTDEANFAHYLDQLK